MSRARRSATPAVSRAYSPEPDACLRALIALLKKSVKEGGSRAAPDDRKGSKHDPARFRIP